MLAALGPCFLKPGALERYPLNPTHHLWRVLVERFGFPFLKTELVLRNPGRLPGVARWPELVPPESRRLIEDHLRGVTAGRQALPPRPPLPLGGRMLPDPSSA